MSGLILPGRYTPPKPKPAIPGNFSAKTGALDGMKTRARYWHDYEYPGDVAHALVRAQLDHRKPPVPEPEQCPNRDCRVCHPSQEDADRLARGHHI